MAGLGQKTFLKVPERNTTLPTSADHLASLYNPTKKPGFTMDNVESASPYIQMAGAAAQAGIDSGNTDYNLRYGGQSDAAKGIKSGIASSTGTFGAIFGAVDAIGSTVGSAMNRNNQYNKYGYNQKEGYGQFYMQAGGLFDPMSMSIRALEQGGEGSGLRALAGLTGLGGAAQFQYEQEQAKLREQEAKMEESSQWQLNQFNYRPDLDV